MRRRRLRVDVSPNVMRQLKRRRWTRRSVVVAVVLLALSTFLDRFGVFRYRGDDWGKFDKQSFVVSHVVDGDTVRVRRSPGEPEETVRLLGIDAPEIGNSPAHWGRESADHLRTLVEGKPVTLRLDTTETRDKYRRLLAYLYVNDSDNLNLALVRDGQVYAHRWFKHGLKRQFEQAEDEVRGKGVGLWANLSESQMPEWRQRWLEERRTEPGRNR